MISGEHCTRRFFVMKEHRLLGNIGALIIRMFF